MGKELAQFFWMMLIVLVLKFQSGTVSTMALALTTAFTLMMLVCSVLLQVCFVAAIGISIIVLYQ